jgi:hypothetical protein
MQHIPRITPTLSPAAQIAEEMILQFNRQIDERLAVQRNQYRAFWDSPVPPDDILTEWGPRAAMMLAAASENVEHLGKLAAFLGKQLADLIPLSLILPRREFIVDHATGNVTLAPPADGHDAWGRPIPEPQPEPEPVE